jgi:hypothetical protein
VAAARDDVEGEVIAVSLDLLQQCQRNIEVVCAEQQPGWSAEPLACKGAARRTACATS